MAAILNISILVEKKKSGKNFVYILNFILMSKKHGYTLILRCRPLGCCVFQEYFFYDSDDLQKKANKKKCFIKVGDRKLISSFYLLHADR